MSNGMLDGYVPTAFYPYPSGPAGEISAGTPEDRGPAAEEAYEKWLPVIEEKTGLSLRDNKTTIRLENESGDSVCVGFRDGRYVLGRDAVQSDGIYSVIDRSDDSKWKLTFKRIRKSHTMKKNDIYGSIAEAVNGVMIPLPETIHPSKRANGRFPSEVATHITSMNGKLYYAVKGSSIVWECKNLTKSELSSVLSSVSPKRAIYVVVRNAVDENGISYTTVEGSYWDRESAEDALKPFKERFRAEAEEYGYGYSETSASCDLYRDGDGINDSECVMIMGSTIE